MNRSMLAVMTVLTIVLVGIVASSAVFDGAELELSRWNTEARSADVRSVGGGVASTSRWTGARGSRASLDECQECLVSVGEPEGPFNLRHAEWGTYSNEDGLCPEQAETCVRCTDFPCSLQFDERWFQNEDSAWAWIATQTNCPDDCGPGGSGLMVMAQSLAGEGRAADLAELVSSSDGALWLNEERQALQGLGCSGRVHLHWPLDSDLADQLAQNLRQSFALASYAYLALQVAR